MAVDLDVTVLITEGGWDGLPEEARELLRTIEDPRFPGAILPLLDADGLSFLGVASTPAEWRKLQPLLLAFAGPTFTNFNGAPSPLNPETPFERVLQAQGIRECARLRPGEFKGGGNATLRALRRLQSLLATAPDLATAAPEPTSRLLADLQDALNSGDLAGAWRLHGRLRGEARLDAINLSLLEMQILAVGGDWSAIRWHPRFEALALANPSPVAAEILLEAIYWTAIFDATVQADRTVDAINADPVAPFIRPLLARAPSPAKPPIERLRNLISPASAPETRLVSRLHEVVEHAPSSPSSPLERAREALLKVLAGPLDGDFETDRELIDALAALSAVEKAELLERPAYRAVWREVQERSSGSAPPSDWTAWVDALERDDFDAAASARIGAAAWRLPDMDLDPALAQQLADKIARIPNGLAEERFSLALPYLVQWAQADPRWPRQAYCSVYLALLTRMAFAARRGETALKSAASLLDGALKCGLTPAEYRDALDASLIICTEGLSRNSGYDALEIVEVARSVAPVDGDRLTSFSVEVASVLTSISKRLTDGQRIALGSLARELGLDSAVIAASTDGGAFAADTLQGKTLGIYTLTETAGRQAEGILRAAIADIAVELNHDHGGSAALAAMVARSDLVVVSWASSKHAATEFIKVRRGARPMVYAAGKGASSIVRAIEEWSSQSPRL